MAGAAADLGRGVRLLGRALRLLLRAPRLLVLGVLPALVTTLLFGAALVVLLLRIDELAGAATPFADEWPEPARQAARAVVGAALLGTAALVGVIAFTAVTLLVGGPFYERLSETVEDSLGGGQSAPPPPWWRTALRGARDSVLLVAASAACAVPLLAAGFVPVLGQTVVPVLGACAGGWLLALELVGTPFARRGLRLRDRHRALRGRRALALGVGVPAWLACAVPFAAVVVMPVAVVAGTLLAREVLDPAVRAPGPPGAAPARPTTRRRAARTPSGPR